MKIIANTQSLLAAAQMAASASATSSTMPVLSSIKLDATGEIIVVTGTDLDTAVKCDVTESEIVKSGVCLVPAAKFIAILRENGEEKTTITATEKSVRVDIDSGRFEFASQNVDTFPDVDDGMDFAKYSISGNELKSAIQRTAFTIDGKGSTRWATGGASFEPDDGKVIIVGTDTRQLAKSICEATSEASDKRSCIVPKKAIHIVDKHVGGADTVKVGLGATMAMFESHRWKITTKILEGRFPPYKSIIPKSLPMSVKVKVADLAKVVRRGSIMLSPMNKRVNFLFEKDSLTVSSPGGDDGTGSASMPIVWEYDSLSIDFDAGMILDYLKAHGDCQEVEIKLGKNKPGIFETADGRSTYLIMPMGD